MPLSRETSLRIRNLLDNGLPGLVRDSRLVMVPLLRLALGPQAREFIDFKERAFDMTPEEFSDFYRRIAGSEVHGATDLNTACADAILEVVRGRRVLEVGCGRGWLAQRMAQVAAQVTASDIVLSDAALAVPGIEVRAASAEALPWPDDAFDVVVSTHTLEHVQDLRRPVQLRRVAKDDLVVVVPRSARTATASTRTCTSSPTPGRGRRWPGPCPGRGWRTSATGSTSSPRRADPARRPAAAASPVAAGSPVPERHPVMAEEAEHEDDEEDDELGGERRDAGQLDEQRHPDQAHRRTHPPHAEERQQLPSTGPVDRNTRRR